MGATKQAMLDAMSWRYYCPTCADTVHCTMAGWYELNSQGQCNICEDVFDKED